MHTIKPAAGSRTKKFRIGRGNASGRGTTAGRGTKGQRARAGGRNKLKVKGIRAMFLSFPKTRGFNSPYVKAETVTLARLAQAFPNAAAVDLKALKKAGLVGKTALSARVVGQGEIKSALNLVGIGASASAKQTIEKAGGTFKAQAKKEKKKK